MGARRLEVNCGAGQEYLSLRLSFGDRVWECICTFDERSDLALLNRIFVNFEYFWWLDHHLDRLRVIPRWHWNGEHVLDVGVEGFVSQRDLRVFVLATGIKIFCKWFWWGALLHTMLTQNASSRFRDIFFLKDFVYRIQVSWWVLGGAWHLWYNYGDILPLAW